MYKKADGIREREEGDKLLLYDTKRSNLAVVEGMGKAVWMLLPDMSLEEIESKLLEFHPEEQEMVKEYFSKFIEELVENNFLVKVKENP